MNCESNTTIIRRKWYRSGIVWLHGLISTIILGAAHSIAPMITDPKNFNLGDGLKKLATISIVSGLIGAATYLLQSPLPKLPEELLGDGKKID